MVSDRFRDVYLASGVGDSSVSAVLTHDASDRVVTKSEGLSRFFISKKSRKDCVWS